ncbi:ABC transporter permease, partial [Mesorhizobium sp. CU2]|uniref:ABC transporter substrate-binding protein n=2 Tax=unclassified Mesorhizobium TaxID=325217 RepID=UPI0011732BB7
MKRPTIFAAAMMAAATLSAPAMAATAVTIGISGWTGFAPLTLAKQAGLFEKHGLDVTLKKVPQASRAR